MQQQRFSSYRVVHKEGGLIIVTAIVIPIIIAYFTWLSYREIRHHNQQWEAMTIVAEESFLEGDITKVTVYKERFYYHCSFLVTEIHLRHQGTTAIVKHLQKYSPEAQPLQATVGEHIRAVGQYREQQLHIHHLVRS